MITQPCSLRIEDQSKVLDTLLHQEQTRLYVSFHDAVAAGSRGRDNRLCMAQLDGQEPYDLHESFLCTEKSKY